MSHAVLWSHWPSIPPRSALILIASPTKGNEETVKQSTKSSLCCLYTYCSMVQPQTSSLKITDSSPIPRSRSGFLICP